MIESSLFEAVTSTGERDVLAMNLADIFAWDIDFILDIRTGGLFPGTGGETLSRRVDWQVTAAYWLLNSPTRGTTFQAFLYQGRRAPSRLLRRRRSEPAQGLSQSTTVFLTYLFRLHNAPLSSRSPRPGNLIQPSIMSLRQAPRSRVSAMASSTKKGYTRGNGQLRQIRHTNAL